MIYIFPRSVYLFCWRKYIDRSWDYKHKNVEIGAEAALFPEKEYISGIFIAARTLHSQPFQIRTLPSQSFQIRLHPQKLGKEKKLQIITVQVLDRALSFLKAFLSFFMETIHGWRRK
jgi:hypothetical protein